MPPTHSPPPHPPTAGSQAAPFEVLPPVAEPAAAVDQAPAPGVGLSDVISNAVRAAVAAYTTQQGQAQDPTIDKLRKDLADRNAENAQLRAKLADAHREMAALHTAVDGCEAAIAAYRAHRGGKRANEDGEGGAPPSKRPKP